MAYFDPIVTPAQRLVPQPQTAGGWRDPMITPRQLPVWADSEGMSRGFVQNILPGLRNQVLQPSPPIPMGPFTRGIINRLAPQVPAVSVPNIVSGTGPGPIGGTWDTPQELPFYTGPLTPAQENAAGLWATGMLDRFPSILKGTPLWPTDNLNPGNAVPLYAGFLDWLRNRGGAVPY